MTPGRAWVDPYPGFEYRGEQVMVSAVQQRERLAACGLDAAVFGGCADPSFFIKRATQPGIASGISAEGIVNMLQSLIQHRPVGLYEPLTVRAAPASCRPRFRGGVRGGASRRPVAGHRLLKQDRAATEARIKRLG